MDRSGNNNEAQQQCLENHHKHLAIHSVPDRNHLNLSVNTNVPRESMLPVISVSEYGPSGFTPVSMQHPSSAQGHIQNLNGNMYQQSHQQGHSHPKTNGFGYPDQQQDSQSSPYSHMNAGTQQYSQIQNPGQQIQAQQFNSNLVRAASDPRVQHYNPSGYGTSQVQHLAATSQPSSASLWHPAQDRLNGGAWQASASPLFQANPGMQSYQQSYQQPSGMANSQIRNGAFSGRRASSSASHQESQARGPSLLDPDFYHSRANAVGTAYNLPGITHLGMALQPLGWNVGNEPLQTRAIGEDYRLWAGIFSETFRHAFNSLESLPANTSERQHASQILGKVSGTLIWVAEVIRHERQQIHDAWLAGQSGQPFQFRMLTPAQSVQNPVSVRPQTPNVPSKTGQNLQAQMKRRQSQAPTQQHQVQATNAHQRLSGVQRGLTQDADADADMISPGQNQPSIINNAQGKAKAKKTQPRKKKPADDDDDYEDDEDEDEMSVDDDEVKDDKVPKCSHNIDCNCDGNAGKEPPSKNWYKNELAKMSDPPVELDANVLLKFNCDPRRFDPKDIKGGAEAVKKALSKKREGDSAPAQDPNPPKKVRAGRKSAPVREVGVPMSKATAEALAAATGIPLISPGQNGSNAANGSNAYADGSDKSNGNSSGARK